MKRMKKIVSVLLAAIMVLGMSMTTFASSLPTGNLTVDESISVGGLQQGDTVNFYKVLEWNDGWKATSDFKDALTDAEWEAVIGNKDTAGEISADVAGKLGTRAGTEGITVKYPTTANTEDEQTVSSSEKTYKAVVSPVEAGLYIAIITPSKTGYTYNPVFVAADYSRNSTNGITLEAGKLSYSPAAIAKLNVVTVDKTASTVEDQNEDQKPDTVAAGDTVSFNIKTVIPGFADNYTKPVFKVTDNLSTGLELKAKSEYDSEPEQIGNIKLVSPVIDSKNYTITVDGDNKGFTINFTSDYLKTVKTATDVVITYDAIVTTDAPKSVNQEDNTVTVNFSNAPSDEEGHGVLKDKTNHYTFDIDGDLFGNDPYKATEVVKIGVNKDGKEITETRDLANGNKVGALQGAEFKLYKTENSAKDEDESQLYTNKLFNGLVTSDIDGRISIKGLDAGTYWLKETKAPDGYIKATDPVKIEIDATIEEVEVTETIEGKEVTYKTNVLKSYVVKINDVQTASYTITNNATTTKITEVNKGDQEGDTNVGDDLDSGKIKNTQGVELPSTGGIGTTIFYVVGAILVIGAGILLVAKKRMSNR